MKTRKSVYSFLLICLMLAAVFPAVAISSAEEAPSTEPAVTKEANAFDPLAAANATREAYDKVKDYTATFYKQERHGKKQGKLETISFKFRKPNDIYMKWIEKPFKGQEAIYRKDLNDNKITAHKGGLLGMVTLDLKPESKLVMKGQHHRISDAGIGATDKLVYRGLMQGLKRKEVNLVDHGIVKLNNRNMKKVEAIFPKECEGTMYEVQKGETLWDISKKTDQDMYVIMTVNKDVDSPKDVKAGQKILIPYHYCYRTVTYIDEETKILTKLEIFDWDNELYEMYEYRDIKLNVGLTDKDFDKKNPGYKF